MWEKPTKPTTNRPSNPAIASCNVRDCVDTAPRVVVAFISLSFHPPPEGLKLHRVAGRSPGLQLQRRDSPSRFPSGFRIRLAAYSCGGSSGIGTTDPHRIPSGPRGTNDEAVITHRWRRAKCNPCQPENSAKSHGGCGVCHSWEVSSALTALDNAA